MKHAAQSLLVAAVLLAAAGCNPTQQRQADRTGAVVEQKGRQVFRQAADAASNAALAAKVKQALNLRQGLSTKRIDVSADARTGAVTLEGSVPSMQQRQIAEQVARTTDGVRSVNDQLAVPPTQAALHG